MKTKLYFGIFLLHFSLVHESVNAQYSSPPWAWAKAFYRTNFLYDPSISVDLSGSGAVYTTGSHLGTVDFDPGADIFNLDSLDLYTNMFISKLDLNGEFVWAKQISASSPGTDGACGGSSMAVDPSGNGNLYVTGVFLGEVDFNPGPGSFILDYSNPGTKNTDIFVTKLDSSGNFKWAIQMGGTGEAWARTVVVDPLGSGDVYVMGSFTKTIDFNPGEESYELTSVGKYDFFIAKLDRLGNFLWAKSIGGTGDDIGFAMAVDPKNSDIYITGDFTGQVNFNPGGPEHIFTSGPSFDIFILKLDSAGNFVWVKPMYGSDSKGGAGYGIALDPGGSGDVYTTGYFEGEVDFNPDGKGIFNLYSKGLNDVFISKLDQDGKFVWAKAMGSKGDDKGNAIAFDPEGDGGVYIMGNFTETTDFDPDSSGVFQLTAVHSNDVFISKLNSSGGFQWAKPILTNQANQSNALALGEQALYTTGLFLNPNITFDSLEILNPSDPGVFWDVFVAKLNTSMTTSITEFNEHHISIYPSPATNELTIEFEGDDFHEVGITMFNVLGEIVLSSPVEYLAHQKAIDISRMIAGIYFVEVNMNGEKLMKEIVKE